MTSIGRGSSIATIEIVVTSPRTARTLRVKAWTRGEEEVLAAIEAPPREEGTATLRVKENLWNYLPRIARTIRVPPSAMLGAWMGPTSPTTISSRSRPSEETSSPGSIAVPTHPPGGGSPWTSNPRIVGRWARKELLVSDQRLPIAERHYDRRGRLARTMAFDEIQILGARQLPSRSVLTPTGVEGQRTELRYLDIQFNAALPDDTFSLSRLESVR